MWLNCQTVNRGTAVLIFNVIAQFRYKRRLETIAPDFFLIRNRGEKWPV